MSTHARTALAFAPLSTTRSARGVSTGSCHASPPSRRHVHHAQAGTASACECSEVYPAAVAQFLHSRELLDRASVDGAGGGAHIDSAKLDGFIVACMSMVPHSILRATTTATY